MGYPKHPVDPDDDLGSMGRGCLAVVAIGVAVVIVLVVWIA